MWKEWGIRLRLVTKSQCESRTQIGVIRVGMLVLRVRRLYRRRVALGPGGRTTSLRFYAYILGSAEVAAAVVPILFLRRPPFHARL